MRPSFKIGAVAVAIASSVAQYGCRAAGQQSQIKDSSLADEPADTEPVSAPDEGTLIQRTISGKKNKSLAVKLFKVLDRAHQVHQELSADADFSPTEDGTVNVRVFEDAIECRTKRSDKVVCKLSIMGIEKSEKKFETTEVSVSLDSLALKLFNWFPSESKNVSRLEGKGDDSNWIECEKTQNRGKVKCTFRIEEN